MSGLEIGPAEGRKKEDPLAIQLLIDLLCGQIGDEATQQRMSKVTFLSAIYNIKLPLLGYVEVAEGFVYSCSIAPVLLWCSIHEESLNEVLSEGYFQGKIALHSRHILS